MLFSFNTLAYVHNPCCLGLSKPRWLKSVKRVCVGEKNEKKKLTFSLNFNLEQSTSCNDPN